MFESSELNLFEMSVVLDYDHRRVVSPLKVVQERRDTHGFQPAFGSSSIRFHLNELTPNPGVGEYDTHVSSVLKKTPSFSQRGFGAFSSKQKRCDLFKEKDVPGPAHYKLQSLGYLSPDQQRPSTGFIPSGNGRVPFPPPKNIPGPSDYWINHDPGRSPILTRKRSATFESVTTRDSFFDKMSPAPGPGKYKSERANKLVFPANSAGDIDMRKNSVVDRFDHIGKDNQVPGVHAYFQRPYIDPHNPPSTPSSPASRSRPGTSHSTSSPSLLPGLGSGVVNGGASGVFSEAFGERPSSPATRKVLVRTGSTTSYVLNEGELDLCSHHYNNDKKPSLRTVGNFRGRHLGKMNQVPIVTHTFGADKDRFKNSVFGRLDLAAQIPGPGTYDYPLTLEVEAKKLKDRARTASEAVRPT